MFAQVTMKTLVTISCFGGCAIIGVYIWVSSHIANRKRHPNAEKVVYMDRFQESQKRVDERHEASEERAKERHLEVTSKLSSLETLVIANGKKR